MSEKLDPDQIMERLRRLLGDLQTDGWHVVIRVTYVPLDGSVGRVAFEVATEPAEKTDDRYIAGRIPPRF